jgi:hypothetical protein
VFRIKTVEGVEIVGAGARDLVSGRVMNKLAPNDKVSIVLDHIFTRGDVSLVPTNPGGTSRNLGSSGITLDREGRILFL